MRAQYPSSASPARTTAVDSAPAPRRSPIARAADFLLGELGDGSWHESSTLKERALAQGITSRTLKRAAQGLVEHERRGWPGATYWRLAAQGDDTPPDTDVTLSARDEPAAEAGALGDAQRYIATPEGYKDADLQRTLARTLKAKWPTLTDDQLAQLLARAKEHQGDWLWS